MRQCIVCVLGVLICLASKGLSRPDPALEDLESALESDLASVSETKTITCDCFVRLDVEKGSPGWFCNKNSDYECLSVSLEELQGHVQTEAETKEWEKKRMELLAQDMARAKPCVCTVKIADEAAVEYFCNDMSCYMLAAEISPKLTTARISGYGFRRKSCQDYLRYDPRYRSDSCCRCIRRNGPPVCSSSHCPVPPCSHDQQIHYPRKCCPTCAKASLQSAQSSCPFYHESPWVMNSLSKCGCQSDCLKKKQEECESGTVISH